jgi:mannose-6-phosphate isomerase-like protein (cupin superfamily)
MKISQKNADYYSWGKQCDGWKFLEQSDLSVIYEKMPQNTCESRHYHQHSRQFFFILTGQAVMELEGKSIILSSNDGIEVPPGSQHQIFNSSQEPVEFLVISSPSTKNDRVNL